MKTLFITVFCFIAFVQSSLGQYVREDSTPKSDSTSMTSSDLYTKETNLLIRLQLGFGVGNVREQTSFGTFGLSGPTYNYRVGIGRRLVDKLYLFGEFGGYTMLFPFQSLGGNFIQNSTYRDIRTISILGLGGGLAYYFKKDYFVSAAITWSGASIAEKNSSYNSNMGLSIYPTVGKEWHIDGRWRVGLALFLETTNGMTVQEAFVGDQSRSNRMEAFNYGLTFSASYR